MKKIILFVCCALFAFSTMSFANPCRSIAMACMKAGYYKGGNAEGKGLVMNCMMPITGKKMSLPNTSFTDGTLNECHAMMVKKMEEEMSQR